MRITNINKHLSTHKLREIAHDLSYNKAQRATAKKILLMRGEVVTV